jgi:hypothetical protein
MQKSSMRQELTLRFHQKITSIALKLPSVLTSFVGADTHGIRVSIDPEGEAK